MNYNFLSHTKLIKARLKAVLSMATVANGKKWTGSVTKYKLIKDLTPSVAKQGGRVGVYQYSDGNKVILKKHFFCTKDLGFEYLLHEASTMALLSKIKTNNEVVVPRLIDVIEKKNSIQIISEFSEGTTIQNQTDTMKIYILKRCLSFLQEVTHSIVEKDRKKMIRKSSIYFLTYFPFYFIKNLIKFPQECVFFINMLFNFYISFILSLKLKRTAVLAHGQLYPDSILYNKASKTIAIVDWESAIISDPMYDLSLICLYYFIDLEKVNIKEIISTFAKDKKDLDRFVSLSIFSCMESVSSQNERHYIRFIKNYLKFVRETYVTV